MRTAICLYKTKTIPKNGELTVCLEEKNSLLELSRACVDILKKHPFCKWEILSDDPEAKAFLEKLFFELKQDVELFFAPYADLGITYFTNVYQNLLCKNPVFLLQDLQDVFRGVPAIIYGAGPSLTEIKLNALAFAGGTALSLVEKVDIGAAIDPYFKERYPNKKNEALFCHTLKTHPAWLSLFTNAILSGSSEPHLLEKWLVPELVPFEAGYTVTTYLISVASYLGCEPIILSGVDLSFEKEPYAKSLPIEEKEKSYLYHNGKWMKREWLFARKWIEDFQNKHQTLLNASQPLKGVPDVSLKELKFPPLQDVLKKIYQKKKKVFAKEKAILQIQKSLKNCLSQIESSIKKEELIIDLDDELAYPLLLKPFWQAFSFLGEHPLQRMLFFQNMAKKHLSIMEDI